VTGRSAVRRQFRFDKTLRKHSCLGQRALLPAVPLLVSLPLVAACAPGSGPAAAGGPVTPAYNATTGRLEKLTYDRNGDGRPDAWVEMDGARLVRADVDEDFDGRVDRREFYVAGKNGERTGGTDAIRGVGVLSRVEVTSGAGESAARVETYDRGVLAAAEEDSDGNGRPDKWEHYENGALVSVALDTRGHGVPDRRLVYGPDGGPPQLETDPDGTGQFRATASAP
jgi:hypothetical protein